ncbi:nuclear transport factor 2 family protein, partial [Acinetobacter baumannii]
GLRQLVEDCPDMQHEAVRVLADGDLVAIHGRFQGLDGTVAKLAMRQPFVLFKGLTFQKLCLPGAFRPGDHHN